MPLQLARRSSLIEPFLAMDIMERSLELEREGAHIIHLEVGEPAFPPPQAAVAAVRAALEAGDFRYTDSRGRLELREAIATAHSERCGRAIDPGRVVVTNGTSPAMVLAFSALLDPGDEVILAAPHYACYPTLIRQAGGVPVSVATRAESGFRIEVERVAEALTPKTRAIVVGSPANPTGAVEPRSTLEALAALGPALVSDEIYHGLVYDGSEATSALEVSDDAFVLDGFSKRYAMTGFRLGYLIAPPGAERVVQSLAQNLFISATSFVQDAGVAALRHGSETSDGIRRELARRRQVMVDGVRQIGFEVPVTPPGAFYVFADARRFAADSRALAFDLLEHATCGRSKCKAQ